MSAHTKGPWRYDGRAYILGPHNEMIAMIRGTGEGLPEDANANLIAIVPELFEKLKKLTYEVSGFLALSAVEKLNIENSRTLRNCLAESRTAIAKAVADHATETKETP